MSDDNTRERAIDVLRESRWGNDYVNRQIVDVLLAAGLLVGNPDNNKVMVDELQGRIMAAHKALHSGDLGEVEMFLSASFDGHIVSLSGMNIADIKALFALHDGFQLGVPESPREALPLDTRPLLAHADERMEYTEDPHIRAYYDFAPRQGFNQDEAAYRSGGVS